MNNKLGIGKSSKKDKLKKNKHKDKDAALVVTAKSSSSATSNGDHAVNLQAPKRSADSTGTNNATGGGGGDDHNNISDNAAGGGIMLGDLNQDDPQRKQQNTPAEMYYAAIPLGMPAPSSTLPDPSVDKNLKPIRDDGSAYSQVSRSCLHICQFAGSSLSSCSTDNTGGQGDAHAVESSTLFHDRTYATTISACFAALITCSKEHKDRRCRILACQTLALSARSAYARIRHAPILFAMRDAVVHRLEDEVGSEVPTALLHVALEDGDDGVSATAVEALGTLALATSNANTGSIIDDELLHEIQSIAFVRVSPYAPSLRTVLMNCHTTVEEDPSIAQLELQSRILLNIMAPRMLQLVTRIVHFHSSFHHRMTLPFLTACLIHQVRTNNASVFDMDRTTYANRWVDLDVTGLINDVVTALVLPSMQHCLDGDLSHTGALCALRLANACPKASWGLEVCRWAVVVLKEENSATGVLESKAGTLASLIIALRAIPLPERAPILESMVNEVASLPYTTMVPHGVCSPGLLLRTSGVGSAQQRNPNFAGINQEDASSIPYACYRKPARMAFFTELALSIFMDGPLGTMHPDVETATNSESAQTLPQVQRSYYLKRFLSSASVVNICKEQENLAVIKMRDEILLVFTTVAWEVGRRFLVAADGSVIQPPPGPHGDTSLEVEEWTRLAFTTLSIFSPCARWGRRPEYLEEDLELLTAGQSSYIRLLQEFLHFVGLLQPSSSVTFKLTPNACPPHLLWDQMIESASFLTHWGVLTTANNQNSDDSLFDRSFMGSSNDVMVQDVAALVDDFVGKDLRQGIISHHMRMFILTLGVDQWVQGRYVAIRRHTEVANNRNSRNTMDEIVPLSLNLESARDLLVAVSPKRLLTKLLEFHTVPVDASGKKKKDPIKKLAVETVRVCVACVENIALTAANWKRRLGSNPESQAIVHMAIASLEGKLDDEPMDESLKPVMGPLCDAAATRIQEFYKTKGSPLDTIRASELVTQPMKYKIKPLVSSSTIKGADREGPAVLEYMNGYLMQLSRQIISSRVNMALFSSPVADAFFSCFSRPRNWLRLETPALPESRDARGRRFRLHAGDASQLSAWGKNITVISAGSDPVAAVLAHTVSRILRYDNEEEYRVRILMQVYNSTAVEIAEGLRLELGIEYQQHETGMDSTSLEFIAALGGAPEDLEHETAPLVSASSAYRQPLDAADQLVWEMTLKPLSAGKVALHPTIVFRNITEEPNLAVLVGGNERKGSKAQRRSSTGSVTGEDDFRVSTKEKGAGLSGDHVSFENVALAADPMHLSPLLGLQPCPLIFFRDLWGDLDTFRFLWFRMPNAVPPIKMKSAGAAHDAGFPVDIDDDDDVPEDIIDRPVGEASCLLFEGEAIPGGFATKLWAFMSLSGDRVMCVMTETETNALSLHLKADNKSLLFALVGSKESRKAVVAALTTGLTAAG